MPPSLRLAVLAAAVLPVLFLSFALTLAASPAARLGATAAALLLAVAGAAVAWRGIRAVAVDDDDARQKLLAVREALDRAAIVALTDTRGKITQVNDQFVRISGYAEEELLGQDHRVVNSGHHPKAFIRDLWETIRRGEVWSGLICNRRKDGERYWVDTAIAPVFGPDGAPRQYLALRFDVTDRVRAERALEQRLRELDAINRELEAFSYSVSHDLRAPLRTIAGFSQILLDEQTRLDEAGRDQLGRVRAAAVRMGALIDDLLALSRVTRREMRSQPVDLAALSAEIVEELRRLEPERVVDVAIADDLVARGDPALLGVLLQNLIGNAWKFTGKVPRAEIEVSRIDDDGQTTYRVRDNGAGFEMAYAGRLFTPFQRLHTEAEFPGTGVGLATVQRIVSRHGGRVWAESEPGHGASIFFTLAGEEPDARS